MYGFAVPALDNPYNTVELRLPTIQQACSDTNYPDTELRITYLVKKVCFKVFDCNRYVQLKGLTVIGMCNLSV